ncbi:vacuolar protein-sorting-associated protein 36 [Capsaspora owczarzaki ATCC 30864]|uniref:Vacuolar protein-sorting-associated protein 36 n=1 Tax=Capsaspora owczarzaki (strain ATCC 30864) TaxID=595528 RepID=A0A0D2WT47_CAPO3|nr:vacuolar protein-sorting-associated protein 36 [Capsaspora owczarzaki ATCC 30864]KJE94748.1 vacuolar protein-sorting-associated protein 36 [Capsaspora owczarzaki ATCC 30864]|eukprot:XP_004347022.1 vacuolar protein-sorting-associated protein 36 [Capsaspora owczarzaki ATCC 30864]
MDRFAWAELSAQTGQLVLLPGEVVLASQSNVALYAGDILTEWVDGIVTVTSHRVAWTHNQQLPPAARQCMAVPMAQIIQLDHKAAFLKSSAKVFLYMSAATTTRMPGPIAPGTSNSPLVKLSFRSGGSDAVYNALHASIHAEGWLAAPPIPPRSTLASGASSSSSVASGSASSSAGTTSLSSGTAPRMVGIHGISTKMEQDSKQAEASINDAFQDLNALMDKAKAMVSIAERFTAKIAKSSNDVSDADSQKFQEYLLSLGIASPVTRATHGTGELYHKELARQLAGFLAQPLAKHGGILPLMDVYCLFNRARGTALISPEDLLRACNLFEHLSLQVRLREFASGVLVVQLQDFSDESMAARTAQVVSQASNMSASDLAHNQNVSVTLAKEMLLQAETRGLVCRDDSEEGLRFYPNRFLELQG